MSHGDICQKCKCYLPPPVHEWSCKCAASTQELSVKVRVVGQGEAEVFVDGKKIGFVSHSASDRGWWAYDANGKRIGEFPDHKRDLSVRSLVKEFYPHG